MSELYSPPLNQTDHNSELLELFLVLLHDERLVEMIEEQLEKEDYLMNSPFLQKVRAEEREEERYEIAKNFKQAGVDIQIIANATGLSIEEIEQL